MAGPPWRWSAACAGRAGGRAAPSGLAESALRLHWHRAQLPTPVPGMQVCASGRLVRLSLGVERRQFGAVLADQVSADDLVALEGAGWRVVVLSAERVLRTIRRCVDAAPRAGVPPTAARPGGLSSASAGGQSCSALNAVIASCMVRVRWADSTCRFSIIRPL